MMESKAPPVPVDSLQFISSKQGLGQETKRNRHLIRSHVSKLNRRRKVNNEQQRNAGPIPRPVVLRDASSGSDVQHTRGEVLEPDPIQLELLAEWQSDETRPTEEGAIPDKDALIEINSSNVLSLRPLSPYFGALSIDALGKDADLSVSRSADYC